MTFKLHERRARNECVRRGLNPDEVCADGGVEAWMVVDQEIMQKFRTAAKEVSLWLYHAEPEQRVAYVQELLEMFCQECGQNRCVCDGEPES